MESSLKKLTFLNLAGASEDELALLERILDSDHSKVELPDEDQPTQLVCETRRLPPDGTEYAAETLLSAAESLPPPPQLPLPPPQSPQQHLPPANRTCSSLSEPEPPSPPPPVSPPQGQQGVDEQGGEAGLAGELPATSHSGVPPLAAPPHMMPQMMPSAAAMFPQPPAGFSYPNMTYVNMPGGGMNMMYGLPAGYPMPPGYPAPELAATENMERRRSGGGKKGGDKPLSALATPYQAGGYQMTPRTATGPPLMMQSYGGPVPYGTQYYPMSYPSYYQAYPGGEMMMAPMPPHQMQQLQQQQQQQQQQLDVTVPPPAMAAAAAEEIRTPLCEPYGRAEEAAPAVASEAAGVPFTDASSAAASTSAGTVSGLAASSVAASTSADTTVRRWLESSAPAAAPAPAAPAAPAPAPAPADAGPVRLSFGFDLEDKLGGGESEAVQLEQTGTTPEPEERAGDGRSSSAEPTEPSAPAPTSYVATVTVSQRRVMPPPPESERTESPSVEESGRGSASPAVEWGATRPESEPVVSPEPQAPVNGVTSPEPEPAREPTQQQQRGQKKEQEPAVAPAATTAPAPAPAPAPAAAPAAAPAPVAPAPAPAAPAPAPAAPAARSWASLFSKKTEGAAPAPAAPTAPKPAPAPPVPETDREVLALGEALAQFELSHKSMYLQPRGLTNKSNWCYINAVLQALASCTPFYHLMKSLPYNVGVQPDQSRTPIIDAMVEFVHEFSPMPEQPRISRRERDRGQLRDVQLGPPLEPSYVYAMLSRVSSDAFRVAGRQEDAEEFLTCLLSGLQDEMTEVLKVYQKNQDERRPPVNGATNGDARHDSEENDEGDSDAWQTIIGKNRGQVTRSAELQVTPISRVFSGQLRSSLHRQGSKATATVQSFFSLQLDIQSPQVSSVEQALEALVERDPVVGLTCPQSGQPIDAYQQVALEYTPPTLILHLKRFLYDPTTDGVQKLLKRVTFPVDLELKKELLSNVRTKMAPGTKRYRLFAIVYHSGKESTKGHYITDAYHPAYQQWVRYDDSSVNAVAESAVLRPDPPLVPYILFYRRVDTAAAHNGK